jgi:Nucleotidyl transferase AbiEii toxin, Type IV TA system
MLDWLELSEKRRQETLNLTRTRTGLLENAIEKDWWVTLALKVAFSTKWAPNLVFKGGTSLSKSWHLIERFSEDIDLSLEREVLGFTGDLSKNKLKALRKASFHFISNDFKNAIEEQLLSMGVDEKNFTLTAQESKDSDRDPQVLELQYKSVLNNSGYIQEKVLIEIGARSLREPASERIIQSIIGATFPEQDFAGKAFSVLTVEPRRTFLEKAFLLHEEFRKPIEQIRYERMSRHLYDLERLMDTPHAKEALSDPTLYESIVEHRKKFNQLRGIDYSFHSPDQINFLPPDDVIPVWENDYKLMRESMIYGEALEFQPLIKRLKELIEKFRSISRHSST